MSEENKEVKTLQVDFKCPKCDDGYLRPNGMCLMSNPPQYPHACNNILCDYSNTFNKIYPYINYISDDSNQADA